MARGFKPQTISSDSALGSAVIQRSIRFNPVDNQNLTRTSSSTSTTFTYSVWIKRCSFSGYQYIFSMAGKGFAFHTNNQTLYLYDGNNLNESTAKFRDSNAWYHIVVQINSGVATSYVNGVLTHNAVGSGFTLTTGTNATRIGSYSENEYDFGGYMAEIHLVDGSVVAPTSFGFTDPVTGIWMPKRYEGTYGTDGFYLDFSDNSSTAALGIDKSPNGNDFAVNNFSVSAGVGNDSLEDTPTNNFCTLNPLDKTSGTFSNGNLNIALNAGRGARGSFFQSSGKWYFEAVITAGSYQPSYSIIGIQRNSGSLGYYNGQNQLPDGYGISGGAYKYNDTTYASFGSSFALNDVFGVAYDLDAGNVYFYKNGSLLGGGAAFSSITAGEYAPYISNQTTSNNDMTGFVNFGQRPFAHTPPTGYKALNLANLPPNVPSIVRPQKHFKCIAYDGDGSSDRNITGLEFKTDLIWIKNRTQASTYSLQDSVIGFGDDKTLRPDTSNAQDTNGNLYGYVNSTFNGGFNLNAGSDHGSSRVNSSDSGAKHVAWCWKAGGATTVANTDGNQTTQVSVNEEAGFSIVTYTGTGSNTNIGHGLGATPDIVITKSRSATGSWAVLDTVGNSTAEYGLFLNDNGGYSSYQGGTYWNDTLPNSTVFRVSSNAATNASGVTYVAYCWRSIPGFSKFGTYKGNGSNDGPFIHTGFRPAWVTVKNTSASNNWQTWDSARESSNVMERILEFNDASTADDASSNTAIDFLSNGFKHRTSFQRSNTDGGTYLYMAFAEQPGTTPFDTVTNAR